MPVILHFKLKPPLDCFSQQTQSTHVLTHYRSDVPHARVCNVSSFRRINPHIQKPSHTCKHSKGHTFRAGQSDNASVFDKQLVANVAAYKSEAQKDSLLFYRQLGTLIWSQCQGESE